MRRVVMFSGGISSWAAAKRVAAEFGTADMVLLFADTSMEDEDLYRFIEEAADNVGAPIEVLADGRTPWQVFKDERFLGNSRVDPCSKILKRQLLDRYRDEHFNPADTMIYVGIDWTELHRYERMVARCAPWQISAPLCEPPYVTKAETLSLLRAEGIAPPRLYEMGFHHNNCGGFCIKAGHAQFATLLRELPERFAYHEEQEQQMRDLLGRDVAILTDRTGGERSPLTLRALRERIQAGGQIDLFDWGGCGCYVDEPDEVPA